MGLETGTYIDSLNSAWPLGATDPKSEGDDHLRLIKSTVLNTFPNITGAVTADHTELNLLDGVTASTSELNYIAGVTSAIQAQLDAKLVKASNLSDLTNAATARTNIGLGASNNVATGNITGANLTTTGNNILGNAQADTLNVGNGDIIKDANGNIGIGVTPKVWQAGYLAMQMSTTSAIIVDTVNNAPQIMENVYRDATDSRWEYITTDFASRYFQYKGSHTFQYAISGTLDTAITWIAALTINNSGDTIFGGNSSFVDNGHAYFGTSNDLDIVHTGTASKIENNNAASFVIGNKATSGTLFLKATNSSAVYKECINIGSANASVIIKYDGTTIMSTVSGGVNFADNIHSYFGTGNDLDIYHSGANSNITNTTGNLNIRANASSQLVNILSYNSSGVSKNGIIVGGAIPNIKFHNNGIQVASTQVGGIAFNADTAAANTLDDYEEGTWTPVLSDGTNNASGYAKQVGSYEKIGRQVTVRFDVETNDISTLTSNARITGLPFTTNSTANSQGMGFASLAEGLNISAGVALSGYAVTNSTYIQLTAWDSAVGTTPLTVAEWSTNGRCIFTAIYHI